jgi:superfamily II DNA or RNA helicase
MARRPRRPAEVSEPDLFSVDAGGDVSHQLDRYAWPSQERFPLNRASARVRPVVWGDLMRADHPLIVAGYSSIAQLVDFAAEWSERGRGGPVRVLLGAEPYPTTRSDFSSSTAGFTEEVRRYWLESQGISLRLSARIVQTIEAIDAGRLVARFVHGSSTLHAKIYVGEGAATVGSSNFTRAGLSDQVEVNARFSAASEPARYDELVLVADNLWQAARDWTAELRELLEAMLAVVGWEEALARACAELLEGYWASRYLEASTADGGRLWPSQRAGIAQALWVTKDVGSVLVADATGSGKTRMGAHLVRAVRDRMWSSGRVRRDLTVVVSPPAVEGTWAREAVACGLPLITTSHGLLSRPGADGRRVEEEAVERAQILAVDEAHNFLNRDSNRTQQLRASRADHVLLFTATPINRGPGDLLALVNLLGADNFEDATLDVLRRLGGRRSGEDRLLSASELDALRAEIARFTVRRTKVVLNELVEREPAAYAHPVTGRVCRYPGHKARTYDTGETAADARTAVGIRSVTGALTGIAQLERSIAVPAALRREYSDERWLRFRLASTRGLAAHHVLGAMRSSRAALVEHLTGTDAAVEIYGLDPTFKAAATGNQIAKLDALAETGPPIIDLDCDRPDWLVDPDRWAERCHAEALRYRAISVAVGDLSAAREEAKAALIARLAAGHERVLAFDYHLITLAALAQHLHRQGVTAVVATGGDQVARARVERLFKRDASGRAVALCSDALNEGLNLQGASALIHLDLPTTLRVAEQRVGRVDRMDSPHDVIEVWWPRDSEAFATRANELLAQRSAESAQLLGSNLDVPDLGGLEGGGKIVDVEERITQAEAPGAERWDGIRDALEPVRLLVGGSDPLIPAELYDQLRHDRQRILARVSPVRAERPWVFLAVAGSSDGAPRWHFLDGPDLRLVGDLEAVCRRLRAELGAHPINQPLDPDALDLLDRGLTVAAHNEFALLPRRMRRALQQMGVVLEAWTAAERQSGHEDAARSIQKLAQLARAQGGETPVDPYLVAERWITVVSPTLDAYRRRYRNRPYVLLSDITRQLIAEPVSTVDLVGAFAALPALTPLAERINSCILGVPATLSVGSASAGRYGSA